MKFLLLSSLLAAGIAFSAAARTLPVEIHVDPATGSSETSCFVSSEGAIPFAAPCATLRFLDDAVEVSVSVPHPSENYNASGKGNDDLRIFSGECVEIMLSPESASGDYYHIAVTPENCVYSACCHDISWGHGIATAVRKEKDSYSVKLLVPYSEMKTHRPDPSDVWRVNVGVALMDGNGTLCPVNIQGATNYHDLAEYGPVVFDGATPPAVESWICAQNRVRAVVRARDAQSAYCLVGGKKETGEKQNGKFLFDFALPENVATFKNRLDCRFFIADASGKETLLRTGLAPLSDAENFDLDSFYVKTDAKTVGFSRSGKKPADLFVKRGADTVLFIPDAAVSGEIPVEGLAAGRYTAELVSGGRRFVKLFFIVPDDFAPPAIGENDRLEIKDGLLYLGEKPVFLFGGSELPKFDLPFASAFNLGDGNGVQSRAVRLTPQPGVKRSVAYSGEKRIVDDLLPEIEASYARFPDHARAFARLAYEAQLPLRIRDSSGYVHKADPAPTFGRLYRELKMRFPDRLFSIHVDHPDLAPRYKNYCDILELTSWRSSFSAAPTRFLAEDLRLAKRIAAPNPLLFWFGASLPSVHLRPPEILRIAVYTAMLERASGIVFHLGHGGVPQKKSRIWSLLSGINAEVQALYPDLAEGVDLPDFGRTAQTDFRLAARKRNGTIRLVAINLSEEENFLEATTPFGKIKESFAPLEVKVFTYPVR